MAQIAEGAGLQQSSIYYWFRSKAEILGVDPRAGEPHPAGHRRARAGGRRARWPSGSTAWCARTCSPCAASPSTSTRSTAWPGAAPDDFARLLGGAPPPRRRGRGAGRRGRGHRRAAAGRRPARRPHAAGRRRGHPELVPLRPSGRRTPQEQLADHVAEVALRSLLADPTSAERPTPPWRGNARDAAPPFSAGLRP